jgi:glutathione S-transferase
MLLVIGNKNYSSWSLRPWLAMKVLGLRFEEQRIALYGPQSRAEILRHSPSGKVPILVDDDGTTVWDSLAILEYLAERQETAGGGSLWPADRAERARARSLAAEMHSGFAQLRTHMSMNIRRRLPGKGRTPEVLAEIERIQAIFDAARGPFLFGAFGAVDAMYAPVVLRFRTYEVEARNRQYVESVLALPALREWMEAAERETETLPQFEQHA